MCVCLGGQFVDTGVSDCRRSGVGVICKPHCHCLWVVSSSAQLQPEHSAEADSSSCARHSDPTRRWLYVCLWPPCIAGCGHIYIFILWFLLSSFFISSPNLSGRTLDVYHTSTHSVALVRI